MFKKNQFKGQGRTIADIQKAQAEKAVAAKPKPAEPKEIDETPWIPKPAPEPEVMPGPGMRFLRITKMPDGRPAKPPPETSDEIYKLTAKDVKGLGMGQPKTFADVRKVPKATPKVAKIKFDIRANKTIFQIEAMFATSEKLSAIYEFLETEIFAKAEKIEVLQTFPRAVIPRDNDKTLVSYKITGSTMLQVNATGAVEIKI